MATPQSLSILTRADELYRQRGQSGAVNDSVLLLAGSDDDAPRFDVHWRLSRALFFLGQQSQSRGEKIRRHSEAVTAAKSAAALNSAAVEGHFWLGVNLALFAEASGGLRAALAVCRRADP